MFILDIMVNRNDINKTLDNIILSASGWRGIFAADGDEESKSGQISESIKIICAGAAFIFAEYLKESQKIKTADGESKPLVLLGSDTRPTGRAVTEAMIPVLHARGCDVQYAGLTAAPEIMAWARKKFCREAPRTIGFIYISASHNPIGHNGLKFGLTDGGVLAAEEINRLINNFKIFINNDENTAKIEKILSSGTICPPDMKTLLKNVNDSKDESLRDYYDFCGDVLNGGSNIISGAMKENLAVKSLGIVCDFNGSARAASIDRNFFGALGFKFRYINGEPGQIAHRIVPEGESLEPCRRLLEEAHSRDASFVLGYVPDCDGDRGNLVIFDETAGKARALEAQEVFALACAAEFTHLVWTGELSYDNDGKTLSKTAVAVNDPTSIRVDRIAEVFGIEVFRAEVGEANVVSLARKLRENGYIVRILGEGSAGGNITHPSAVRDPVNTVLAIAKMLTIRAKHPSAGSTAEAVCGGKGFFEIWCELSGQTDKYRGDFSVADIIASLPEFISTPAYHKDAIMRIKEKDHSLLKDRYQKIFLSEWARREKELNARFCIYSWEAIAYNGMTEKRGLARFGEAGKGGLKILFSNEKGREIAYIWMRGSATEPVFRIMADAEGNDTSIERYLLDWQRQMIMKSEEPEINNS